MANPSTAEPATATATSSPSGPVRTSRRQAEARAVQKVVEQEPVEAPAEAPAPSPSAGAPPRRVLPPRKRVSTRMDSPPAPRMPLSPVALGPNVPNRRASVSRATALVNSARRQGSPASSRPDSPVADSASASGSGSGRTSGSSSRKSTPGAGLTVNFAPQPQSEPSKLSAPSEPAHALRSVRSVDVMSTIPFPPAAWNGEPPVNKKKGGLACCFLDAEDVKDDRLMATFAALDVNGNRAMAGQEIGDYCVSQGWIRQSPALSSATVINNVIRTYVRKCQSASPPRPCLLATRKLTGSMIETQLAPALHPTAFEDGKRPKGAVWYIKGRLGDSAWTDPFEAVFDEIEKNGPAEDRSKKAGRPGPNKKGKAKQVEAEEKRKSSGTPTSTTDSGRRSGRSREGTEVDAGAETTQPAAEEAPRAGLKIRLKVSRPVAPSAPVEPDAARANADEEDVKPVLEADAMVVDSPAADVQPAEPTERDGDTDTDWSMSDSDDSDDDASRGPLLVAFPPVGPHTPPVSPAKRCFPPGIGDSHLFPCNPLDPVNLHELRDSHAMIEDSSSDEDESFSLQGSLLGSFNDFGPAHMSPAQASFFRQQAAARMEAGDEEVDTPATTPRHGSDWERDEKPSVDDIDNRAKNDFDLQNAVHVLGSLLPSFPQTRSAPSQDVKPSDTKVTTPSATAPPPPPSTPVSEGKLNNSLSQSMPGPERKGSLASRSNFKLHIPLPRMVASSPLASPQAHYSGRTQSGDPDSDIRSAIELLSSPTRDHQSLDDRSSDHGSLMPPLPYLEEPDVTVDMDDECVCEVEDVEMIWEQTEGMTLGDSPPSDVPETTVGSPSESGFVLMDPADAADQGAAIDIVNWSRTNHLAEGVDESHDYWIKPISGKAQAPGQGENSMLNRDVSPVASTAFELESSVSMLSPGDGSDAMAPIVTLDDLTKQDWSNLLGPESVGIEELDQVWGLFGETLAAEGPRTRSRRGNSEETVNGGKRTGTKAGKSARRGRAKTVGEWGQIGVGGHLCVEVKKEKASVARALLASSALTASARSQSRDSRRAIKNRVASSDKAETDDGVGIFDLEEAAKDFDTADQASKPEQSSVNAEPPTSEDGQDDLLAFASIQGFDDYYPSLGIPPWLLSAKSEATTPITPSSSQGPQATQLAPGDLAKPATAALTGPTTSASASTPSATPQLKFVRPAATAKPPAKAAASNGQASSTGKAPGQAAVLPGRPAGSGRQGEALPRELVVYPQHNINPSCRAQIVDRIPVFQCVWQSTILLRRIDSEYINVSALLKAINAPRAAEIIHRLAGQPTNVMVVSNQDIGTAGVWTPLHIAREVAKTCNAAAPLLDVFLHDNLPNYFPLPLPKVKVAFKLGQGRAANCFGLPFGCVVPAKTAASAAASRPSPLPVGRPPTKPVSVTVTPATPVPSPALAASAPAATPMTNKRPSPPAVGDAIKPTKRRKSIVAGEVVAQAMTPANSKPAPLAPASAIKAPTTAAPKAAPAPVKPAATVVTRKVAASTTAAK